MYADRYGRTVSEENAQRCLPGMDLDGFVLTDFPTGPNCQMRKSMCLWLPGNREYARQSEAWIQDRPFLCIGFQLHPQRTFSRKELLYEGPALALAPEATPLSLRNVTGTGRVDLKDKGKQSDCKGYSE